MSKLDVVEGLAVPPKPRLWTPIVGHVRLQVGYPDHPDPGELVDTGWAPNSVLPFLPFQTWALGIASNGTPGDRYVDGTAVYPSWNDIWAMYQASSVFVTGYGTSSSTASTSPLIPNNAASAIAWFAQSLIGAMAVGNYTSAAPAGNVSTFAQANWTTFSLVRRALVPSAAGYSLIGQADSVYFGPAVNSQSITGTPAPSPGTTVSRTFAAQAGTVNAIAFVPLALTPVGTAIAVPSSGPTYAPNYLITAAGGAGTSLAPNAFIKGLAASGDPLATVANAGIIASTFFLASAAVTVPTGGNLTVSYTLNAQL